MEEATNESIAMREELEAAKRQAQAKIALPKKFEGKREDLNAFLAAMGLYHRFNSTSFLTDQDKILSTMMNMAGEALAWAEPFMSDYLGNGPKDKEVHESTKELFRGWESFKDKMKTTFGEVDAENVAQRRLLRLRQQGLADLAGRSQRPAAQAQLRRRQRNRRTAAPGAG
jgi:hypothetical protein